jgi:hypothetical protein
LNGLKFASRITRCAADASASAGAQSPQSQQSQQSQQSIATTDIDPLRKSSPTPSAAKFG